MLGLFGLIKQNLDFQGKLPNKWKDLPEWANRMFYRSHTASYEFMEPVVSTDGVVLFEQYNDLDRPVQFDSIASKWVFSCKVDAQSPAVSGSLDGISGLVMGSQEWDNKDTAFGGLRCSSNLIFYYSKYPTAGSKTEKSISHKGDIYLRITHEAGQLSWKNEYSFDNITWNLLGTTTCTKGYSPKMFIVRRHEEDTMLIKDVKFELDGVKVFDVNHIVPVYKNKLYYRSDRKIYTKSTIDENVIVCHPKYINLGSKSWTAECTCNKTAAYSGSEFAITDDEASSFVSIIASASNNSLQVGYRKSSSSYTPYNILDNVSGIVSLKWVHNASEPKRLLCYYKTDGDWILAKDLTVSFDLAPKYLCVKNVPNSSGELVKINRSDLKFEYDGEVVFGS